MKETRIYFIVFLAMSLNVVVNLTFLKTTPIRVIAVHDLVGWLSLAGLSYYMWREKVYESRKKKKKT